MGARTTRSGEGGRPPRIKGIRVEGLLSDKGPRARDTPDPRATSAPTSRTISVRTAVTIGCVTRACTPLRVQMTTLVRRSRRPQGWKLRTGIVKCTPGSCCEHEGHRRKREGREYAPRSCTAGARPGRCQPPPSPVRRPLACSALAASRGSTSRCAAWGQPRQSADPGAGVPVAVAAQLSPALWPGRDCAPHTASASTLSSTLITVCSEERMRSSQARPRAWPKAAAGTGNTRSGHRDDVRSSGL